MSKKTDNLSNLVIPYGLSEEESRIYLYLLKQGFCTALSVSRQLKMGRTKVYRLLDRLRGKQLVEFQVNERGMRFGASHPSKFGQLISQKEEQVKTLKKTLPDLMSHLSSLMGGSAGESKVLYYKGREGLKQVSYNITKADGLLRVFEVEHMSDFTPHDFAEHIRLKLVENKIKTKDLTNKKSFEGYTEVSELVENYSEFRYIDPKKLRINFEVLIYNDVYATYSYKENEIFCVEIYNKQLAEMQKQIFDFIWNQAQPMQLTDKRGASQVK